MGDTNIKKFNAIKEQLSVGRLSPGMNRWTLIRLFFVSMIFTGLVSLAIFTDFSDIHWRGFTQGWQVFLLVYWGLFIIQLCVILFLKQVTNRTHFILLLCHYVYLMKLGMDFIVFYTIWLMDQNMYQDVKYLLLAILLLGVFAQVLSIHFSVKFRKGGKRKKQYPIRSVLFMFTVICVAILFRSEIYHLYTYGDSLYFFLGVIIYVSLMSHAKEAIIGIYCYIKYPSFRIEANRKK